MKAKCTCIAPGNNANGATATWTRLSLINAEKRKWPEEKPIESGMCLVFKKWAAGRERIVDVQFFHVNEGIYDVGPEWFTHWMPMIPLPRCE